MLGLAPPTSGPRGHRGPPDVGARTGERRAPSLNRAAARRTARRRREQSWRARESCPYASERIRNPRRDRALPHRGNSESIPSSPRKAGPTAPAEDRADPARRQPSNYPRRPWHLPTPRDPDVWGAEFAVGHERPRRRRRRRRPSASACRASDPGVDVSMTATPHRVPAPGPFASAQGLPGPSSRRRDGPGLPPRRRATTQWGCRRTTPSASGRTNVTASVPSLSRAGKAPKNTWSTEARSASNSESSFAPATKSACNSMPPSACHATNGISVLSNQVHDRGL